MAELFAWAIPSPLTTSPVDHTWVTTYDAIAKPLDDLAAVVAAGEDYWTCWGVFHARGRQIANSEANIGRARCHALSNDTPSNPGTRGTIRRYGMQGVCHQLSNQVLAASSSGRITVKGARGYRASTFIYGTYGLDKNG